MGGGGDGVENVRATNRWMWRHRACGDLAMDSLFSARRTEDHRSVAEIDRMELGRVVKLMASLGILKRGPSNSRGSLGSFCATAGSCDLSRFLTWRRSSRSSAMHRSQRTPMSSSGLVKRSRQFSSVGPSPCLSVPRGIARERSMKLCVCARSYIP